jgi:hypothetical protein
MPKLGSGEIQFQGCVMDSGLAICLCFHKPQHAPNKDKINVYLTKHHIDQDNDFSLVLDSDGNEDVILYFGNHSTFKMFELLVKTLAGTNGAGAAPSPVAAEDVKVYNAGLEAAAEVIADFDDWIWCDCPECRVDAGSHAVKTQASLTRIATAIRALKK